jgi:hypothetical protein
VVASCKNCHVECVYAEIPSEGVANWFFPKKPRMPPHFTHRCENCGRTDMYERNDLTYRDETMPSWMETKKCAESGEPSAVPQALEGNSH